MRVLGRWTVSDIFGQFEMKVLVPFVWHVSPAQTDARLLGPPHDGDVFFFFCNHSIFQRRGGVLGWGIKVSLPNCGGCVVFLGVLMHACGWLHLSHCHGNKSVLLSSG